MVEPTCLVYALGPVLEGVISGKSQLAVFLQRQGCGHDLQSSVIASIRFRNQISFDKLLCLVGAQMQLESLPQSICCLHNANGKARHLRITTHHRHQVDDIVSGAAQR